MDRFVHQSPHWCVTLNDGQVIFQDDCRPGLPADVHHSAWVRLRTYCRSKGLFISRLHLRNKSNVITPLPANQSGYYFAHQAMGVAGLDDKPLEGIPSGTFSFFILGHVDREDKRLLVRRIKVPELQPARWHNGNPLEERLISPDDDCLILMP